MLRWSRNFSRELSDCIQDETWKNSLACSSADRSDMLSVQDLLNNFIFSHRTNPKILFSNKEQNLSLKLLLRTTPPYCVNQLRRDDSNNLKVIFYLQTEIRSTMWTKIRISSFCLYFQQVIQTFSAKDQDLPMSGQQFSFKSPKEDVKTNKNFTIRDFGSKCSYALTTAVFGAMVSQWRVRLSGAWGYHLTTVYAASSLKNTETTTSSGLIISWVNCFMLRAGRVACFRSKNNSSTCSQTLSYNKGTYDTLQRALAEPFEVQPERR